MGQMVIRKTSSEIRGPLLGYVQRLGENATKEYGTKRGASTTSHTPVQQSRYDSTTTPVPHISQPSTPALEQYLGALYVVVLAVDVFDLVESALVE
eukprot:901009-Rhodomonas_salina.1